MADIRVDSLFSWRYQADGAIACFASKSYYIAVEFPSSPQLKAGGWRTEVNISYRTVIRLGALAAILAGILRAATSFISFSARSVDIELLYLGIDLLLLFAIVTVYAYVYERSGWLGLVGFVFALAGTGSIVGPDGTLAGVDMYFVGATTLSIGLAILSVAAWRGMALPRMVCALWIGSTLIGIGGFFVQGAGVLFRLAGLAFALGFLLAGFRMWRKPELEAMDRS